MHQGHDLDCKRGLRVKHVVLVSQELVLSALAGHKCSRYSVCTTICFSVLCFPSPVDANNFPACLAAILPCSVYLFKCKITIFGALARQVFTAVSCFVPHHEHWIWLFQVRMSCWKKHSRQSCQRKTCLVKWGPKWVCREVSFCQESWVWGDEVPIHQFVGLGKSPSVVLPVLIAVRNCHDIMTIRRTWSS